MLRPASGDDWVVLNDEELPVTALHEWAVLPGCGAVVAFIGTVRDHADGRIGVEGLTYEAYVEAAERRCTEVIAELRLRWPTVGRVAAVHRLGALSVSDVAVVVVVSAPHRDEAFEAARYAIDTIKETVPIWKHETWRDGADWGTGATPIREVQHAGGPPT